MTDKEQIMTDGVEVLKEKINMCFILLLNKLETPETIEQTIYEHLDAFVKEWNAQLARKTQIIDDVEEVIKPYQEQIELDAFSLPIAIESILERKTQECEELKEENQKLEMQLCNNCGERDDYNIPCKMIRDLDYGLQKEIEENDRYRKALEEIEKHIESYKEQCNIPNKCVDNRLCSTCFLGGANELGEYILDIINKVKG